VSNKSVKASPTGSPLKKHIIEADEVILNYEQSVFSFTFAALNFIATEKNEYAYMLEGFDKDWQFVQGTRSATYTNLDPGNYVFKVKASNNDGVWNEQGTSLNLIIKPPFWMTWWFKTGTILLLLSALLFYLWLYRRIEIKKINEQKIEDMHQMQLQFFTNISHEFRTPLSLIIGGLEKAKEFSLPDNALKYFSIAENNTKRLTQLINDLLNFRKAGSGMMKLHVEQVNLKEVTKLWAEDFLALAEQRNIQFEIFYYQSSSFVYLDKNILEKIILNILNNAFKYSKNASKVSLKIYETLTDFHPQYELIHSYESKVKGEKYSYFVISDTGIGIDKDATKFLFERYYRITDDQMGTGIGLAFVKTLTLLHKGFIKVYSKPKTGTEILIALPTDRQDYNENEREVSKQIDNTNYQINTSHFKPQTKIPLSQTIDQQSVNTKLILLVEDNTELRTFIEDSLQDQYKVLAAEDGAHAVELLMDTQPDMIISDVMMPNMDGIALCKYVKENKELNHIPFILLTAKDSIDDQLEGVSYGANYYLAKPISIKFLMLTIQNIFAHQQKLKLFYLTDYQQEIKKVVHSTKDRKFLDQVLLILEDEIENPDLNVEFLCQTLGMSQTKFYKRLKEITGKNITEFVRTVRLKKAAYIIAHEDVTIGEVMHKVGISSPSYFTAAFKKEFGKTPSQYLKER
jgi:signal transduction histidine kinase/DNA-binding response OmpR family regulator